MNPGLFRAASLQTQRAPFNALSFPAIYAACATGAAWMCSWQSAQTMSVWFWRGSSGRVQHHWHLARRPTSYVGEFRNGGREWQPKGSPEPVNVHDFKDKELGKVTPYGIYDVGANTGWVAVGTDHDTAAFAVATIAHWWQAIGQPAYPHATRLLICADGGGSNGYRTRLQKTELARLAAGTGLQITVCHLPPGTSKWNKIEHRLFSRISMNWRGRPLTSHEVIVQTIAATTTRAG